MIPTINNYANPDIPELQGDVPTDTFKLLGDLLFRVTRWAHPFTTPSHFIGDVMGVPYTRGKDHVILYFSRPGEPGEYARMSYADLVHLTQIAND